MIDAGTMMNLPARDPAPPVRDRGADRGVDRGLDRGADRRADRAAERGTGRDRAPGQAVSQAAREHGGIRRAAEDAGYDRPSDFLATLRAQLRDGVAVEDPDGEAGAGQLDGEDAALLDELIDLEVVPATDAAVGYGATLLGLIEAHAELDAAAQDALSEALSEAGLVDGEELDAGELADALAEAGLVDGEELTDALAEAGDAEAAVDDTALLDEELLDAEVDEDVVAETPADAAEDAADTPAADAPPPTDGDASDDEESAPAVAAAETAASARPARGEGEGGELRGTDRARQVTPPERHGRSAEVRADHLAPGSERSARPEFTRAEFTRAATEAEAFRFATTTAPSAEANAEVAQATLRAAARMSALPPQVQRILDAAQRLENLPPPRQLTLELGEVRVRVAMDDGGLRLSVLSGDSDVGDDLLREARDLLEQQGFDLARDGDGEAAGDEQGGPGPGGREQDAARARRARRGGLRL